MEREQLSEEEKAQWPKILEAMLKTREKLGFKELVGDTGAALWRYNPQGRDSWLEVGCGNFHRSYIENLVDLAGLRLPTYYEAVLILMNDKKLKKLFLIKGFEVASDEKFKELSYINTINDKGEFVGIESPKLETSKKILERTVEVLHGNDPPRLYIYGYAEGGVSRYHLDATNNHGGHHAIVGVPQDWKMDSSLMAKLLGK